MDYYATPPEEIPILLKALKENGIILSSRILEPACGNGSISKVLERLGYRVFSYDLMDRGYGKPGYDYLLRTKPFRGDILTNPPFSHSQEFIEKSLELIENGNLAIFLVKLNYLSGQRRSILYRLNPPRLVLVYSYRIGCGKGGDFSRVVKGMDYCWIVFQKGYRGKTTLDWIGRDSDGLS